MRQLELMCKRLAIIVDGHLQCIGTIDHLREKFGQGMTVKIQLSGPEKERVLEVQPVMTALFPDSRLIYYHRVRTLVASPTALLACHVKRVRGSLTAFL
ncbi:hypothetical protein HPB48_009819 [Haemaphysalis longicornis]|uniref:Uncharacterized protein n=1 Tax=Haemaphysalis longicornis TaxID=44386 RepID=A0A9J6G0R5_HAELO|nr:hypothetical protein HPB48_009819 [Haemaphysalis longicornis]